MTRQYPINTLEAGIYEWTMVSEKLSRSGHTVVRGPEAGPIGPYKYPPGTETWYWSGDTGPGGTPSYTLTLTMMCDPDDKALIAEVGKIQASEKEAGVMQMVPDWQKDAPLPSSGDILTLVEVKDGPGSYDYLYQNVSFYMPIDGDPVLPTFYTDIPGLYSIFGGDPKNGAPIKVGITAVMIGVKEGAPGYPDPNKWLWYGRNPK